MITVTTENPLLEVRRYLSHWSNRAFVDEKVHERHPPLSRDQQRRKARDVAVCVQQGIEYLAASEHGSTLTRPLALFYAAENLAKAICVLFDPQLGADSFKAHGLQRDKGRRNSIKNLSATIQDPGSDVWSHFVRNGNWELYPVSLVEDDRGLRRTQPVGPTQSPPAPKCEIAFGDLIRQLPDLADNVNALGWGPSYAVHVSGYTFRHRTGPPETLDRELVLRHGHDDATREMILSRTKTILRKYELTDDSLDVIRLKGKTTDHLRHEGFRGDIFGRPYLDLNQTHLDLAELPIFLASLFILSSAARYDPGQWQRLLEDHPGEAILVDRFLDVALRKVPNLVLNAFEGDYYQFTVAA